VGVEEGARKPVVGLFPQLAAHLDTQIDEGAEETHLHHKMILA